MAQYNVIYHIVTHYSAKHNTLQYITLQYTFNTLNYNITPILSNNTLQKTILILNTPCHNILSRNTVLYIDQSIFFNDISILHDYIHQINYIINITFGSNKKSMKIT